MFANVFKSQWRKIGHDRAAACSWTPLEEGFISTKLHLENVHKLDEST